MLIHVSYALSPPHQLRLPLGISTCRGFRILPMIHSVRVWRRERLRTLMGRGGSELASGAAEAFLIMLSSKFVSNLTQWVTQWFTAQQPMSLLIKVFLLVLPFLLLLLLSLFMLFLMSMFSFYSSYRSYSYPFFLSVMYSLGNVLWTHYNKSILLQ